MGGWDTYSDHWRYFFECMLAPTASQTQSALEKLPVTATPRASIGTPSKFMASVMSSWTAMVSEITRGGREVVKAPTKGSSARLFAYALAPQHGPVIRTSLSNLAAEYRNWTQDQVNITARSSGLFLALLCVRAVAVRGFGWWVGDLSYRGFGVGVLYCIVSRGPPARLVWARWQPQIQPDAANHGDRTHFRFQPTRHQYHNRYRPGGTVRQPATCTPHANALQPVLTVKSVDETCAAVICLCCTTA